MISERKVGIPCRLIGRIMFPWKFVLSPRFRFVVMTTRGIAIQFEESILSRNERWKSGVTSSAAPLTIFTSAFDSDIACTSDINQSILTIDHEVCRKPKLLGHGASQNLTCIPEPRLIYPKQQHLMHNIMHSNPKLPLLKIWNESGRHLLE